MQTSQPPPLTTFSHLLRHAGRGLVALGLWALIMGCAGCFRAHVEEPAKGKEVVHHVWLDYFVFGLVGDERLDVRAYCDEHTHSVQVQPFIGTALVSVVTIGIYTPQRVEIICEQGLSLQ